MEGTTVSEVVLALSRPTNDLANRQLAASLRGSVLRGKTSELESSQCPTLRLAANWNDFRAAICGNAGTPLAAPDPEIMLGHARFASFVRLLSIEAPDWWKRSLAKFNWRVPRVLATKFTLDSNLADASFDELQENGQTPTVFFGKDTVVRRIGAGKYEIAKEKKTEIVDLTELRKNSAPLPFPTFPHVRTLRAGDTELTFIHGYSCQPGILLAKSRPRGWLWRQSVWCSGYDFGRVSGTGGLPSHL